MRPSTALLVGLAVGLLQCTHDWSLATILDSGPDGGMDSIAVEGGSDALQDIVVDTHRDASLADDGTVDVGIDCGNTQTSVFNCGACGMICAAPAGNFVPICDAGTCTSACQDGYYMSAPGTCTAIPAPRLLSPMSTSRISSAHVELRWVNAPGADGGHVEICRDRDCTMVLTTLDATGQLATLTTGLPPSVTLFWRVFGMVGTLKGTTPSLVWEFRTPAMPTSNRPSVWGSIPDVNGDGIGDVIVGTPAGPGATQPRVDVFDGSTTGPSTTPGTTIMGAANSTFGGYVAMGGDLDGDGYGDVVVPWTTNASHSYVTVYFGAPSGLSAGASVTLDGGSTGFTAARGVGDMNGDGYGDLAVGTSNFSVLVFLGHRDIRPNVTPSIMNSGATITEPSGGVGDRFGEVIASGDVNGDRLADVVVGAPGANSNQGAAYLYLGSSSMLGTVSPTTTLMGPGVGQAFGSAIAADGDVNGDGLADVIVTAPGGAGQVSVFDGNTSFTTTTNVSSFLSGNLGSNSSFGTTVAYVGDIDSDGHDDVAVGAPYLASADGGTSTIGAVVLYRGQSGSTQLTSPQTLAPSHSAAGSFRFGAALSGGYDLYGGGEWDLVIGAPDGMSGAGEVDVYRLGSGAMTPAVTLTLSPAAQGFGTSLALIERGIGFPVNLVPPS